MSPPDATPRSPGPNSHVPSVDDARAALEAWQEKVWFVPEQFSREAELSEIEPAFTISAEVVLESRTWAATNGEPTPDPWGLQVESPSGEAPLEIRFPDSERKAPCAVCNGFGKTDCGACAGLGRGRCAACSGTGCSSCGGTGVVACVSCAGAAKVECLPCEGAGAIRRANVLVVRRKVVKRRVSKIPALPKSPTPSAPPRPILDLRSRSRAETGRRLERLHEPLKSALARFLDDLSPEGDFRLVSERVSVEQIPVWKASWKLGKRSGAFWLHDEPLRARVPYPPRNALLFAITAWTALLGLGFVVFLFMFFRGRGEAPDERGTATKPRAKERVGSTPPSAAPTSPEALSDDGMILLTDGRILRGPMSRDGISVVVQSAEERVSAPPWQIEIVEPKSGDFIRSHLELLAQLEKAIGESLAPGAKPTRASLVARLLDLHRHRDRWTRLQPLCKAGELPAGPGPVDRLDALKERLDAALEARPAAAAAPDAPPVANPQTNPQAVPAPAAVAPAAELLRALEEVGKNGDGVARMIAAQTLAASMAQEGLPRDLLAAAWIFLSRTEREWRLENDRLEAKASAVGTSYEGTLEVQSANGLVLRLPGGEKVIATKGEGPWTVRAPGNVVVSAEECSAVRGAPSRARTILSAHLDRIPPRLWIAATPESHLSHARMLAAAFEKDSTIDDRGRQLLRMFAAAHAAAAMRFGSVKEIEGARDLLTRLGYVSAASGAWLLEDDATALTLGRLLQESRLADALALVPQPQGAHGFAWWYRAAAVRLSYPMLRREDIVDAMRTLDRTLSLAVTEVEQRHIQALKDALSHFRVCAKCGGDSLSICSLCHGKGTIRTTCSRCGGHGVIIKVGQGGGTMSCPSCQGKPDLGARSCGRCGGTGKAECPSCRGVVRLPRPPDLGTLEACPLCSRAGAFGDLILNACPTCLGLGLRLIPLKSPDAPLR